VLTHDVTRAIRPSFFYAAAQHCIMCGVTALLLGDTSASTAAVDLHNSLYFLQHRGQDAAGITSNQGGRLYQCKGNGLVAKVFDEGKRIQNLPGSSAIAHLRYPTAGTSSASEAQPFYVNSPFGLSLACNGNLVNNEELQKYLDLEARRHINTDSDSELLLNVFAHALGELGKARANVEDVFKSLQDVYARCHGAFACTALIAGFGILGFRDQNGIRPLMIGERPSETKDGAKDYMMASESIALQQLGFTNIRDILPGEAVFIEKGGDPQFRQIVKPVSYTPDLFEFVYFARPDSTIDGISVYKSRRFMGSKLAKRMKETMKDLVDEIDVVIPVPETSNTAAVDMANELGKPCSNAFVKNRYVFRTFILPNQKARMSGVRRKLSPIHSEFKGKVVCLLDDSIVRGTTSKEIVQMAREAGATKVIFASCSPAVKHPHVYGIDLADPKELIAHSRTDDEIAQLIGADRVIYLDLEQCVEACIEARVEPVVGGMDITAFEVGVFNGQYRTAIPDGYFDHLSCLHGKKKSKKLQEEGVGGGSDAQTQPVAAVVNGGPMNVSAPPETHKTPGEKSDISLHNFGDEK